MKMTNLRSSFTDPTAPSESLLYPDLSSVSERLMREAAAVNEQQINEKIQANNKFNNNINIINILEIIMKLKLIIIKRS